MDFKLEHVALNVSDPVAMAKWYERYIGLKVVRKIEAAHNTHFLADNSGTILLEIYNNPPDKVPSYSTMDPLQVHLGFVSDDPDRDKARLLDAGAREINEMRFEDGTHLVMMRDPWGLAIQLCKRSSSMLTKSPIL